jgi:hypothetical protein
MHHLTARMNSGIGPTGTVYPHRRSVKLAHCLFKDALHRPLASSLYLETGKVRSIVLDRQAIAAALSR